MTKSTRYIHTCYHEVATVGASLALHWEPTHNLHAIQAASRRDGRDVAHTSNRFSACNKFCFNLLYRSVLYTRPHEITSFTIAANTDATKTTKPLVTGMAITSLLLELSYTGISIGHSLCA